MALVFKFIFRIEIKDAKQATKVFAAFGYQNPAAVDLTDNDFHIRLDLEEQTGKQAPEMPQWIFRYRDSDLTGEEEKT